MVTGASTAHLAVILIDARHGIIEQSRRHATLSSLLGIRHLVAAVNKMDLVDWDEARFREIEAQFGELTAQLGVDEAKAFPISALHGDNVVERGSADWYDGPPLLEHLEEVDVAADRGEGPLRLPGPVGDPPRGGRAARAPLRRPGRGRHAARRRRGDVLPGGGAHHGPRRRDATTGRWSPPRRPTPSPSSSRTTSTSAAAR